MKQIQRVISFLLALVLVLGMVPSMAVRADETETTQAATEAVAETTAPTETVTEPVAETTAPTEASTEPVEETTVPTEAVTEPVEETTAPTEMVTAPAVDTTVPVEKETAGSQIMADAMATSIVDSGTCGENVTWTLDDAGTLTISGTGDMGYGLSYDLGYDYDARVDNRDRVISVVIEEGVTSIGSSAFSFCPNLISVSIPSSVTKIENMAFQDCSGLMILTIPASVTHIADSVFPGCTSLTGILVEEKNSMYVSDDGVLLTKDGTRLLCYPIGREAQEYSIPSGVTYIGSHAFSEATLTQITIPESVKKISTYAFCECKNLTSITIPSVEAIYYYAFLRCTNLSTIIFQGDAPTLDENVFYDVTATAYYPADNSTWAEGAMQNYGGTITWVPYIAGEDPWIDGPKFRDYFNNDTIKINGAGSAYAYYVGEPNTVYSYLGGSREGIVTSDENGVFRIPLGSFDSVGTYKVITEITQIAGEALDEPVELDARVTVTPISFTQEWEMTLDADVALELTAGAKLSGPLELEATLGKITGKLSGGSSMKISRDHSAEGDTLELISKRKFGKGVSVKSGVTAELLTSEFDILSASAGVAKSNNVTYGIEIENFSANKAQMKAVGTYLLGESLLANPNSLFYVPFYNFMAKKVYANSGVTVINGSGVGLNGSVGMNALGFKVNDQELFSGFEQTGKASVSMSEQSNTAGEKKKTVSFKTEGKIGSTVAGELGSLGKDYLGMDISIAAKQSSEGKAVETTSLDSAVSGLHMFVLGESYKADYNKYAFTDKALGGLLSESNHFSSYVNGNNVVLSALDLAQLARVLSTGDVPIDYSRLKKDQVLYSLPLDAGAALLVGGELSVDLSYLEETDYSTATGYAVNDQILLTGESDDLSTAIDSRTFRIEELFSEALPSLVEDAASFFKKVIGSVKDGVESAWGWVTEKTGSAVDWVVSIVTADGQDSASAWNTSYRVAVLDSYPTAMLTNEANNYGTSQTSEAATIGRPFLITVTDSVTGDAVTDLSAEPLEFTIRYAREDLQAAGLSILHPTVKSGGIAMYRYSDEGDFFEFVGGTNDLDAMTVTADIIKPGQYVLAVDACAPTLSYLDISDYRETPTITAYIDDLTGLNADSFSFKLDGVEKVNGSNVAEYYNTAAGIFTYTVTDAEKLTEGEHTLSFTLADTTGNVQTYEYTFQVDLTAPAITDVTANGYTNAGSVVEIRAQVSDHNLTSVYAILSKLLPNGTWSEEVTTAMGDMGEGLWGLDYEGDGSTILVFVKAVDIAGNETNSEKYEAHPFTEAVTLSQEYTALKTGQNHMLTAQVQPVELAKSLQWSVESNTDAVITVDQNGVVTAKGSGTDYVIATVVDGNNPISARCRIDVAEPIRIGGIQLSTTKLTSELYSTDYAQFDLLLQLPQNVSIMSAEDSVIPESKGVAIEEAWFAESGAKAAFDLVPLDDRRIAIVPTEEALQNPQILAKSYKSRVTVVVDGREYTTPEELTITLKQSLPKLKATVPAFNAFYTGQTQQIVITGGTVTNIAGKQIPEWLTLGNHGALSLNEKAGTRNSGKAYLLVDTKEWVIPAEVTVSVKNTYKVPGLKLSASSVKMAANASDSSGVSLKLLTKSKKDTLSGLNVQNITVADEFKYNVENFDRETGEFILKAENGFQAGTMVLNVSFSDTGEILPLELKVTTQRVSLKLAPATVTLNKSGGDKAQIRITATPADYRVIAPNITGNEGGFFETSCENGILTILPTDAAETGKIYSLSVSAGNSKPVTLKVKVTEDTPTVTLKAKSGIDLSFPERTVSVVPAFKNYASGEIADYTAKVTEPDGTVSEAFAVSCENGTFLVECKDTDVVIGTYRLYLTLKLKGNVTLETDTKLTVKRTAVKLKLSPGSLTLNKKLGDRASVAVTCTTKGYDFSEQPMWELKAKNRKDSAAGKLEIKWEENKLQIAVNEATEPGATYNLQVKANKHAPAANLAIKIVDVIPTVSLKASGTIDVIREGTAVLVTPSYKNCMDLPRSETLKVYSSADKFTEPVAGLFHIERDDYGRFVLTAEPGLDHTKSYKVELESTVSGITVNSAKISVKVKMGSAKLTVKTSDTILFAKDKYDRAQIWFEAKDATLNKVASIAFKNAKQAEQFEIIKYGDGHYAIGFKSNNVDQSLMGKTVTVTLNVFMEGNYTAKANTTANIKLTLVK